MTEQIRVRDLIEYLKQQDPNAKVTAGGIELLWDPPRRMSTGQIDLALSEVLLATEIALHVNAESKELRQIAQQIRGIDLDDEDASDSLDEIASEIVLTAESLESSVTP